jgi:hypothetical protein
LRPKNCALVVIDVQEKLLPPIFERTYVRDVALQALTRLRNLYEPYALSLATYLRLDLPPWIKGIVAKDN